MRFGSESLFFGFHHIFYHYCPHKFFLADTAMAPIQGSPKVGGQYVE